MKRRRIHRKPVVRTSRNLWSLLDANPGIFPATTILPTFSPNVSQTHDDTAPCEDAAPELAAITVQPPFVAPPFVAPPFVAPITIQIASVPIDAQNRFVEAENGDGANSEHVVTAPCASKLTVESNPQVSSVDCTRCTSQALVDLCRPVVACDIIGMQRQMGDFIRWTESRAKPVSTQKKLMCLLAGPPGVGKTSAAHVVARKFGLRVVEINASDNRNSAHLRKIIESTCLLRSSNNQRQMLLVEEIDGAYNGGNGSVVDILLEILQAHQARPHFPVVVATCNEPNKQILRKLKTAAYTVTFSRLNDVYADKLIARSMGVAGIDPSVMTAECRQRIINASGGDARQLLYSLQMIALLQSDNSYQTHVDRHFQSRYDVMSTMLTKRPDTWRDLERNITADIFVDLLQHNLVQNVSFNENHDLKNHKHSTLESISAVFDDMDVAASMHSRSYLDREDDTPQALAACILTLSLESNGTALFKDFGTNRVAYPIVYSHPPVMAPKVQREHRQAALDGQDMLS